MTPPQHRRWPNRGLHPDQDGSVPTVSDLRQWCARTLPDYMVPSLFVEVSAIPLTANGKADRRALPAPEDASDEVRDSYVEPQTPVQRTIAAIWQDVLGVSTVGLHDNFFELGGNSFLSIQVSSSMIDHGLTVGTRPIFENPTIFALAAYLGDAEAQDTTTSLPALRRGDSQLEPGHRQEDVAMTTTRGSASAQPATPAEFIEMNDSPGPRTAFLVHEISGSVFSYLDLAREIADTHRAVAIEAPAYGSPVSPPQHDICAIARQYSRQIIEHSPGPYTLAGYSFGGLIALEIACTLEQEGHRVSSVALIDSYLADAGIRDIVKEDLRALDAAIEARSVDRPEVEVRRAVETVVHRFQLTEGVLELRASEIDKYLRILRAHTQASLDYHPRAPRCPVRLLQATESADRFRERRAWSSYPGQLEVTSHYGDHRSVMHMPGVASVARDLAEFWTAEAR